MSAAKNLIDGLIGMVDHVNATHFKIGLIGASLAGEFEEYELRDMFGKLDRARWRLSVLQNCVGKAVTDKVIVDEQFDWVDGSTVPESSSAVARDHGVKNGDAD